MRHDNVNSITQSGARRDQDTRVLLFIVVNETAARLPFQLVCALTLKSWKAPLSWGREG